jgi:uncharacterized protein
VEVVDREREIDQLRGLAARPPALVVLRGRRRVGKTFLLSVALTGERVLALQAEERPLALQLEAFARECATLLAGEPPLAFDDWAQGLELIEQEARSRGPIVLILDEFQYLAASDPGLVSTIQRWWDRWDREEVPVMIVLSGSALSFMKGLLAGAQPTFGRSVYRPLLLPLTYRDAAGFAAPSSSPAQLMERFAVLGGTPQYQRWAGSRSLHDAIERSILPPDAPLHADPEHLVRAEGGIREPGPYFGALEAISEGYTTTTAIADRLEMKQQLAGEFLSRLEDLGYVSKDEPLEPGGKGAARGHWRILDPFFRFWFRFVFPNRSRLARGRIGEVAAEIQRDLAAFVGPIFEDCCREWLGRYSRLGEGATAVGRWWSRRHDTEIDVVAVAKSTYSVLGSCKWSTRALGTDVLDELYRGRAVLGPKAAQAELVLFSRSGFTRAARERGEREAVHLVEISDLF